MILITGCFCHQDTASFISKTMSPVFAPYGDGLILYKAKETPQTKSNTTECLQRSIFLTTCPYWRWTGYPPVWEQGKK